MIGLYFILTFNQLVKNRNLVNEAWSGIDVQLNRRHDLIPLLVDTVKAYAAHERNLFEHITELRSLAQTKDGVTEQEQVQIEIAKDLSKLFVVIESYPELKASENFLKLQQELVKVEHDLQRARRYYNGTVRDLNTRIEQFPARIVAKTAKFEKRLFFDIQNKTHREAPEILM